jgi:methylated-DNA-[protein]-cysteine S-methyltransferase
MSRDAAGSDRLTWTSYECPVGPLTVVSGPAGLRSIGFPGGPPPPKGAVEAALPTVTEQLDAYFAGDRREFDLDLEMRGDRLQLLVWEQLLEVPYGSTISYGEMAQRIDGAAYPDGIEPYMRARIVGAALGRNPIAVVVPCHRVIGADGSLVGFGGGLDRKRRLLELEGVAAAGRPRSEAPRSSQLNLL